METRKAVERPRLTLAQRRKLRQLCPPISAEVRDGAFWCQDAWLDAHELTEVIEAWLDELLSVAYDGYEVRLTLRKLPNQVAHSA